MDRDRVKARSPGPTAGGPLPPSGPRALVLSGQGLNCEDETARALRLAGARTDILHISVLIERPARLRDYQIMVIPGGFSYGDHTGAGNALALMLSLHLDQELREFASRDTLLLGICNGFQALLRLGLLPGGDGEVTSALLPNEDGTFVCQWVGVDGPRSVCPLTCGLGPFRLPVAHGEGRFEAPAGVLASLEKSGQVALRYAVGENPNGSAGDIAGLCDPTGRVLGLMPHPERAVDFIQTDDWPRVAALRRRQGEPLPEKGPGRALFERAVKYFADGGAS